MPPATAKKRKPSKKKSETSRKGQLGFVRLERAVRRLAEDRIALIDRAAGLDLEIEKRNARIRDLESELREATRLREEVAKGIDDLMARLDQIETEVLAEPVPVAIGRGK